MTCHEIEGLVKMVGIKRHHKLCVCVCLQVPFIFSCRKKANGAVIKQSGRTLTLTFVWHALLLVSLMALHSSRKNNLLSKGQMQAATSGCLRKLRAWVPGCVLSCTCVFCCWMYPVMIHRPIWAIRLSSVAPAVAEVVCHACSLSSRFTTPSKIWKNAHTDTKLSTHADQRRHTTH